LNIVKPEHR